MPGSADTLEHAGLSHNFTGDLSLDQHSSFSLGARTITGVRPTSACECLCVSLIFLDKYVIKLSR